MNKLTERMAGDEDLCCTTPVILYAGKLYETWRDRLVKAHPRAAFESNGCSAAVVRYFNP